MSRVARSAPVAHNPADHAAMAARIAALEAENAALKARGTAKITLKVSEKGALSVYGLQRWPITLYAAQWRRLLAMATEVLAFLDANADTLATKE